MKYSIILLMIVLSSCNLPTGNAETATPTGSEPDASSFSSTPDPFTATPEFTPTPEFTATPEFTPTPEFTATPTIPIVSVSVNTNCRTGPGAQYDLNGGLNVGETAEVIGKNTASGYWIIKTAGGVGYCWLWGQYATVSGNTVNLPEYPVPATPTPSKPEAPKNLSANVTCVPSGGILSPYNVEAKLTWVDAANNEDGYYVYMNGGLLATLAADSTGYTDNTTLASIWLVGDPQPSHTYEVQAYNAAGSSDKKSVKVLCP